MEEYTIRLAQFEGPLDLLLHLVRGTKLNIEEISLAEITDQYLEYMAQLHEIDMERASAFLETASVLLLIKSRALLPAPPKAEPEDEEDPEKELLEKLRIYEVFKKAAKPLGAIDRKGPVHFYKLPEDIHFEGAEELDLRGDADMLQGAFARVLRRWKNRNAETSDDRAREQIASDAFSVRRQKEKIEHMLADGRGRYFAEFFHKDCTLEEIVVTFIAVLELWAAGSLELRQERPFAPIEVWAAAQQASA